MATFKTPDELRAWSRSFYNKSSIIKRGFYNYISPDDEKDEQTVQEKNNLSDSEIDPSDMASSIIAKGNASSANISELFSLDSSTIEEMNSKFPTTEEQILQANKESTVLRK